MSESKIKRYDPDTEGTYGLFHATMREEPDGDWVRYEDYQDEMSRHIGGSLILQKNLRDTFEALCAMRDSINEYVPMPSLESDLLEGPETSVFCSVVAEAVISKLRELTSESRGSGVRFNNDGTYDFVDDEPHSDGDSVS